MSKSEKELAEAMNKLAESLNRVSDPVHWQKIVSDAMRTLVQLPESHPLALLAQRALPPGIGIPVISVELTEEQRRELAGKVAEQLEPQLAEFRTFVRASLQEMPAHRLKELAEKVEQGAKPKLKRRGGCIFVCVGDEEDGVYLNL